MKTSPQIRRHHYVTPFLFPTDLPSRLLLWLTGLVPCHVIMIPNHEEDNR